MTLNRTFQHAAFALAALAFAAAAQAHGTQHSAGPVKKEQKDWGIAGDFKPGVRTVKIRMLDTMRFSPDRLTVRQGETVRLVMSNAGATLHELVIGTKPELEAHAALMLKFPGMEHDEPYMAHVPAGKKGEIVWTFNRAGEFDFACLVAGHYQAGMVGKIVVTPSASTSK
jgi:uncharacterized cupredoxin-like copper-binding protein